MGSVTTLKKLDGVQSADFDSKAVEVTVVHDPKRVGEQALMEAITGGSFTPILGAGKGSYAADPEFADGLDVVWVNKDGADVDPDSLLVEGKITVVDFYAVWCGPCKDVDRAMSAVLESRPDVALRKIDVADWDSPVATARLSGIKALPYIIVYGPDGKRRDTIAGKDLDRLHAAIGPAPASMVSKAP
jgi:thioredoxin 1